LETITFSGDFEGHAAGKSAMKVLVTGGTGVVGQAAVTELKGRGHAIRLLSRNAEEDVQQWPEGVEPWPASISDPATLRGCAEGCDIVVHVAGIMEESPPGITYEGVNVEGTRSIVREAERCRVGRLIYLSSLGAEDGTSPYHRSKRRAEEIVRGFAGGWIILRPGNVYGPGDEVISVLLTMVRSFPVVPVVGSGDEKFQPIWVDDLAAALAEAVRRTDLHGRVLELAGDERTTLNGIIETLAEITGRTPARVPIPTFLASAGITMASLLGVKLPVNESQLTMLSEENVIRTPGTNALTGVLHIKPTPLDSGLRKLADAMPEQTPDQGVGMLKRKRFWVDIAGSQLTAEELFARFRTRFAELTPLTMDVRAEPGTPTVLEQGTTITMALPLRGNVQIRVEYLGAKEATLVTLAGHPLAGAIRFLSEQIADLLRFQVQVYDRPANLADWFVMRTVGEDMQAQSWESLLQSMVEESGGVAVRPIAHDEESLDEDKAERVEAWVKELVLQRKKARQSDPQTEPPTGKARRRKQSDESLGEDALL
jgi:uncharacterized protein YbjT (DUF2867 family)